MTDKLIDRMQYMQRGRLVSRFHNTPTLTQQGIDAHSYGVAMLTTILVPKATPQRRATLLMAALEHDLAEQVVGDVPSPAKRVLGMREKLNAEEAKIRYGMGFTAHVDLSPADQRVLKMADVGDGLLFCIHERMMGNTAISHVFNNYWGYLVHELHCAGWSREKNTPSQEEGEEVMIKTLARSWRDATGEKS